MANESFLSLAKREFRSIPNSFTVHITKSPRLLNWKKSPRKLLAGIITNKYLRSRKTKRSIGHLSIEITCQNPNTGATEHRLAGQGAVDVTQYVPKLIKDGFGFSIMLTNEHIKKYDELNQSQLVTIDGKLEGAKELDKEYSENIYKKNLMGFATYKINYEKCQKMIKFYDEYKKLTIETAGSQNPQGGNNYGFGANTKLMQGAGCATFLQEFFEIAGLKSHFRNFFQRVYVDKNLLGDPLNGKEVNISKLLFSFSHLSKAKKGRFTLDIPSPDLMFEELRKTFKNKKNYYKNKKIIKSKILGNSQAFHIVFE